MRIPEKPTPNEKFFKLRGRDAVSVAWKVAKRGGEPDIQIFNEWIGAYRKRNKKSKQLTIV